MQSSRSCVWATTGPPATRGPLDNRAPTRRCARPLRLSDCFPCPNGLIWHVRRTDADVLASQPGPAEPASIFRPRGSQGIRDQRRVGRAAKGRIRRDRRRQSGQRPVPPPAQARNVELPAAGATGPHLCLGGREGRRGHARQSAPEQEAGTGAQCVMSPLRSER